MLENFSTNDLKYYMYMYRSLSTGRLLQNLYQLKLNVGKLH